MVEIIENALQILVAGTFHAVYNILVLQEEAVARVGYIFPVFIAFCLFMARKIFRENSRKG